MFQPSRTHSLSLEAQESGPLARPSPCPVHAYAFTRAGTERLFQEPLSRRQIRASFTLIAGAGEMSPGRTGPALLAFVSPAQGSLRAGRPPPSPHVPNKSVKSRGRKMPTEQDLLSASDSNPWCGNP